ncbi:phosphomannomutase/phosphoglucomutase [Pseudohongiella spirulinae]|uniref:phosphomannomutase n=1 Tax=Pseudohongiella spirulinae TaxID=1249552 RepID=A0A0S2KHU7_9GAMM|nr:phosphomannomutase/phosphoglucomutase [Pseudohongiella spirulinae]ALO47604.1 Phosphoglucomutase [Pseudohongiella spirulinae]
MTAVCIPDVMFRAYDIRGIAHQDLTTENIRIIGQAIGYLALQQGIDELLLGADGRLSSPALGQALINGILDSGCHVIDLGVIATPLLYFATHTTHCDSGVMLTASHNPADYNGIKMVRHGTCLTPEEILGIRDQAHFLASRPDKVRPPDQSRGKLQKQDIKPAYIQYIKERVSLQRPLKVVVDCGNAVPGLVAPELYRALGCEVIELYCELDGRFPNHHPDPTINANLASLIESVKTHSADLGVALDGDGDRVVMVTDQGRVIDTDRLLMLLVRDILPRYANDSPAPKVVFDVKCSNLLAGEITRLGGQPVMSRSGHSFMKQKMRDSGAVVGGEFSAHIFIKDRWFGYDDGPYTGARFLEILARSPISADQMLDTLPPSLTTPELRIAVEESEKFELMARISKLASFPQASVNCLDGVRADFKDGWGLIRASNTTPALLLRFEACNAQALQTIQQAFRQLLQQVDARLDFVA